LLELLAKYAENIGLAPEPGFLPKTVRWCIVLDEKGYFMEVIDFDPIEKKGRIFKRAPDLKATEMIHGGITRSHFMTDTVDVVALFGIESIEQKDRQRVISKHEYFIKQLEESSIATSENMLCAELLKQEKNLKMLQERLKSSKAKKTEKIAFKVGDVYPIECDSWNEWWYKYRQKSFADNSTSKKNMMRCFQTGNMSIPLKTHPKISGLGGVGGLGIGCVLIGFDKEAFSSYNLEQSANSAVSEEAASIYAGALNDLIKKGNKLANVMVVHWYKDKVLPEEDPLSFLIGMDDGGNEELEARIRVNKLLCSIRTGERAYLADNTYYSMLLSATGGRVMLREWMEGDFVSIASNIWEWFNDLEIISRDGQQMSKDPKFLAVLGSTVRVLDDLNSPFVTKMWRSAVFNEPIPLGAVTSAVLRIRSEIVDSDKLPSHARMGLIKAYHLRKHRNLGGKDMSDILKPVLNENHPSKAYQSGRLMAVLADVQRSALGDIGAGIVQRYYASAYITPALVLGRLTRLSQFHLNKLDKGLAYWYENIISSIWSKMGDNLPATLNIEEQSLFALGYYQQMASMRTGKKKDVKENNNEEED